MAGLFICFCSSIWFISGIQSQSMITTISQRSISTSVPTLLKISSTVVQPVISSVDNANSSRNSTDGFINKPNVSLGEISRTVVKPDPSSPLNPQVSRSAQAPTSGNVTTPILNTTVSTGGGSTTFPTKLSTQQIATTTLFTRRTTTGPQGTDIPIDLPS
ncbi:uncharacterized protein LOC114543204 [Dendronephthya gigantea]|uniref:uncharacterized protein LOC114543204 n=1 Tax=Dendronephthya gigantea TaxID=151771 RepID=UPI00106BE32D|nr:uncharacterized protein LOC114543204 [Dendronephthya gigantea]